MADAVQPIIIIKRKKVVSGGGHHGGAWKVAYADFVTAMMAFFLLMWLLNATTEEQRKGIADYFSPSIPIASISGGGDDALQGDTVTAQHTQPKNGTGAVSDKDDRSGGSAPTEEDNEEQMQAQLETLNEIIKASTGELAEHIFAKMTEEGLVIELIDSESDPLFTKGSAKPSRLLDLLTEMVAAAFTGLQNNVKIIGHTDNIGFVSGNYSNWDLSTDRANTARRLLIKHGFDTDRITELSGKAYTDPVVDDPSAAQNRRISITILK